MTSPPMKRAAYKFRQCEVHLSKSQGDPVCLGGWESNWTKLQIAYLFFHIIKAHIYLFGL